MMKSFFEGLRARHRAGVDGAIEEAIQRIDRTVGGSRPRVWTTVIDTASAPALRVLPALESALAPGDEILFCGDRRAYRDLEVTMNNGYVLSYLVTGIDPPRGWVMTWLRDRFAPRVEG